MFTKSLVGLALASLSSAHFILLYPQTAGFDDDMEPTSPCGGATVMVNSSSPQVSVDRFAISIENTHPAGEWMFRGTTDTEAPFTWTDLTPVVNTTGVGNFCLDMMKAPSNFAGKGGVIQVIDNSVDGTLYQCAPVNFVTGANTTLGSSCTNATSFTAMFTDTQDFVGSNDSSSSASSSMTASMSGMSASASATGSGSAASATSSAAGAVVTMGVGLLGGLGAVAAGLML